MISIPVLAPYWLLVGLSLLSASSSDGDNGALPPAAADKHLKPFSLELFDFPITGRGVRTTVDRVAGDVLIQIPLADIISNYKYNDDLSSPQQQQQQRQEPSSSSQEQQLAIELLRQKNEENHPYVTSSILPKEHFSFWTLPLDLWNDMVLPRCYRESFQATRDMVSNVFVDESFLWAFSMVRSRSIAVPELDDRIASSSSTGPSSPTTALIPGLDLFNHAFDAGTLLQLDDDDTSGATTTNSQFWTLTSSKSYKAGDQLFLSYGEEKDNWKLLLTYGFAVENNPNPLVFWTWEDLLDAAGQARPSVFPERVRKQLFWHPQLYEVYSKPSETRATFSYNAKTQTQRESLQGGLEMLQTLAVQLGHDGDNSLSKDVIAELMRNRIDELTKSINSIEVMRVPLKWRPFTDSVLLALKEEKRYFVDSDT